MSEQKTQNHSNIQIIFFTLWAKPYLISNGQWIVYITEVLWYPLFGNSICQMSHICIMLQLDLKSHNHM